MEIQIFNYEENNIRGLDVDGVPYFVAKDVCDILELTNITESLKRVDVEDLTSVKLNSGGQDREMKIVNESGLYSLILFSNKPEAKKFKKWVTSEVLPSIRKTGKYEVQSKTDEELILIGYEKLMEKVKYLTPKAESHDRYLSGENAEEMAVVAQKLFGDKIGRNTLLKMLRQEGILKENNTPHQEYMKYFKVVTKPTPIGGKVVNFPVTLVWPEGVDFIMRRVGNKAS